MSSLFVGELVIYDKVVSPQVNLAKAKNMCQVCRGVIPAGDRYVQCLFVATPGPRNSRGDPVFYTKKMKFCRGCSPALLKIIKEKKMSYTDKFKKEAIQALRNFYGTDRYKIALGKDPVENLLREYQISSPT